MFRESKIKKIFSQIYRSNGIDLNQPESSGVKFKSVEILLVQLTLGVVLIFTIFDIGEDIAHQSPLSHMVVDIILSLVVLFALSVLLNRTKLTRRRLAKLQAAFFESKVEVERSREQAEQSKLLAEQSKLQAEESKKQAEQTLEDKRRLLLGLGECIDAQLDKWNLSTAEKDIALLLLKGLSHSEIAEVRQTSERTVRQQSLKIYAKAGLKGRSDLAAFFLEDMLAPLVPQKPASNHNKPPSEPDLSH